MASELCEESTIAKNMFDEASEILQYDLIKLCSAGPQDVLDSTAFSQPAIFVSSCAAAAQLSADSPDIVNSCTATMGLSLGELSSLYLAKALKFCDGVRLTHERGVAMQLASDVVPSGMIAVSGLSVTEIKRLCIECEQQTSLMLKVANYLAPQLSVIAGHSNACDWMQIRFDKEFPGGTVQVSRLAVSGAFHTPLMSPAYEQYGEALARTDFLSPPDGHPVVYSNVTGLPYPFTECDPSPLSHTLFPTLKDSAMKDAVLSAYSSPDMNKRIRDLLMLQLTMPVQWETIMRSVAPKPNETPLVSSKFYEIGPGTVCTGILKKHFGRRLKVQNIRV